MTGPNDRILPPRMVGPDRIFAGIGGMSRSSITGERGLAGGWSENSDHLNVEYNCTEYIRRDPAVLAALPEVQALIRQAVEAEREACADVLHDDQVQVWADEIMFDLHHAEVLNIRDYEDKVTAIGYVRAALCNIAAAIRKRGEG